MTDEAAHIDFETRSTTDLTKAGIHVYCMDPNTWPWGMSWRIGKTGLVRQWRPGYADPVELLDHVSMGGTVTAHNNSFDRHVWNMVVRRRIAPHWPELHVWQCDCTMARAATIAHPQKLEQLCEVLDTPNKKDMAGHALMRKMMKPRRFNPDGTITWWDDPLDVDRNMLYCDMDVLTETDIEDKIPPLNPRWRKVWEFDQEINERGITFDRNAITKITKLVEYSKKQADRTMRILTNREVPKCTNVGKIIEFLNGRGITCTTLKKGDQDDLMYIADLRDDTVSRDVVQLRKAMSKTSTAKYAAMSKCICEDDRIRHLLNFNAANTGRWGGRLVQPQNFPRVDPDDEVLAAKIQILHDLLQTNMDARELYEHIEAVWGPLEPLMLLSKALRSMIMAAPGHKLVGGDFANIEGRVNAWLGNETWKLDAFREYDAGTGPDLYKVAYARSFGVRVEDVGKGQKRQIGKVQELALGYQGGVGATITMGDTYGVNPYDLSAPVQAAASAEQWDAVAAKYVSARDKYGLQEREWTAIRIVVDNWRAAHPGIVQSWWDYQDAAIDAVANPGQYVYCANGRIAYFSDTRCLWCILPSGRMLCYASPELRTQTFEYTNKNGETVVSVRNVVWFQGIDSLTKQWVWKNLYGGLQCENIVQATACDILVDAMFRVEAAGFPVILTVHDEILSELLKTIDLGEDEFRRVMADIDQTTYAGLPIAVSAWEGERYLK